GRVRRRGRRAGRARARRASRRSPVRARPGPARPSPRAARSSQLLQAIDVTRELGRTDTDRGPPAELAIRAEQPRELVAEQRLRELGIAIELDPVARVQAGGREVGEPRPPAIVEGELVRW